MKTESTVMERQGNEMGMSDLNGELRKEIVREEIWVRTVNIKDHLRGCMETDYSRILCVCVCECVCLV